MLDPIRKLFKGKQARRHALPAGERAYVIGDVHGRRDLLEVLIKAIEQDIDTAEEVRSSVIFLGDLIDRGPDSKGVIDLARTWTDYRAIRFLMGNHEEMFLDSFKDLEVLRHFLKHGGRETIMSYGVTRKQFNSLTVEELQDLIKKLVPKEHRHFIKRFEDKIEMGDYLFVHAGINPKRPMAEQRSRDMRWIREPFLNNTDRHSHMIVHGHTILEEIDERPNRIGIDTGAYRFGKLTALVLEGDSRRFIQTVEKKSGKIKAVHLDAD